MVRPILRRAARPLRSLLGAGRGGVRPLACLLCALALAAPARAQQPPEGTEYLALDVDGASRRALLEPPAEPTDGLPPALILLHDTGQSPAQIRALAALDRDPAFARWLKIYPEGIRQTWNVGRKRVDGGQALQTPDLAFLRALVAQLEADARVDPTRLALAGFGEGGAMVLRTICEAPGLAAAAVVVAGTWPASLNCSQGRPTPALLVNGTADPLVPYEGGQIAGPRKVGTGLVASVRRTASSLAAMNLCGGPVDRRLPEGVTRREWSDCVAPLTQYRIQGGGHRWPGAPDQGWAGDGLGPPIPVQTLDLTAILAQRFLSLAARPGP